MNDNQSYSLKIGRKTFINTAMVLLVVMIIAFVLTQVIPLGKYERTMEDGREVIVEGSFMYTEGDYVQTEEGTRLPLWRLFTAPLEVFASPDASMAIMIIFTIMFIGGVFLVLEKCGLLSYAMQLVINRFAGKKYVLLAAVTFFGMLLGSAMGLFEETVILTPITVALAVSLGWDALVGMGMSILAVGFGFSASTFNPFTTGTAQRLAGLPMFSGLWLRVIMFVITYVLLYAFLYAYARRIEKNPSKSLLYGKDVATMAVDGGQDDEVPVTVNKRHKKALVFFGLSLLFIAAYVIAGAFLTELTSYSMPVIALVITIGGICAGFISGHGSVMRDFGKGLVIFLPSAVLLMLAMSVKHIIVSGNIMDTLLKYAYDMVSQSNALSSLLIIFLFVLGLNFFIGGATAKAFLIIPLLAPLSKLIGLTRQSIVLAFCFGDGFSNMIYPTNAVLLIAIGIIGIPYMTWFKWTWKLQVLLVAVSAGALCLSYAVGYGPF